MSYHSANVLADNVKFEVNNRTYLNGVKVGILESIRNDSNLEGVIGRITNGQADAVNRDRAFIHCKITATGHLRIIGILKGEIVTALSIINSHTTGRLIHMALHNVAIQSTIHHHATLHVHLIAHLKQA